MTGMDRHREDTAPLRRARVAAWLVALSMAGTTMTFQVYHSIHYGRMIWPLAYLYGIVPLAIALLILEFASVWDNAPVWAKPGAYVIMGGAMYLSAESTGAVVLRAAPNHMSWVFGILMDGAALLAVHYILNGPSAAQAAAEAAARETAAAQREAALRAELGTLADRLAATETAREAAVREAAETAERYAETEAARTELRAELEALADRLAASETAHQDAEQRAADAGAYQEAAEALRSRADALAGQLTETETARDEAGQRAADAEAKAERLARRLAAADKRKPGARKPASSPRTNLKGAAETEMPEDFDAQTEALRILAAEPGISGAKLAERVGRSERWGQLFKSNLAKAAPKDIVDGTQEPG